MYVILSCDFEAAFWQVSEPLDNIMPAWDTFKMSLDYPFLGFGTLSKVFFRFFELYFLRVHFSTGSVTFRAATFHLSEHSQKIVPFFPELYFLKLGFSRVGSLPKNYSSFFSGTLLLGIVFFWGREPFQKL